MTGQSCDIRNFLNLTLDHKMGTFDSITLHAWMHNPHVLKAGKHDPDSPKLHEALSGAHRDAFMKAMEAEIADLQKHETWQVVKRSSVPEGAQILPGTWVFKIKRFPDGRLRKHKARFCARGDLQETVFDTWAPVASWSTIRMLMVLSMQEGWATRQVDFSNAFVQSDIDGDVFIEFPAMFDDKSGMTRKEGCLKLKKSLHGLCDAPKMWFNHLKQGLDDVGIKPSKNEPGLHFGRGMVVVTCDDDTLFFGPNGNEIDKVIKELEEKGFSLTREDMSNDVFAFLGVEINKVGKQELMMSQTSLIEKVLLTTGLTNSNRADSPANIEPLGTDAEGKPFCETWSHASVVGMLMHLSANAHPEIQFAVHQCARFTHCPRDAHAIQ